MPREARNLITNEIYHIIQRGIEDRLIFLDKNDYYRGVFSLYEFNNDNPVEIRIRRAERKHQKTQKDKSLQDLEKIKELEKTRRNLLVEIFCFCLMPNHIHLVVKQLQDGGISRFIKKMGGYATYFNQKYKRKGHLFQNQFKAIHIADEEHLKTEFVYVHTNPVSLTEPGWKERGIGNLKKVVNFIENYKWSSYADYIGGKNFPSLTNRDFMTEIMGGVDGCRAFVDGWLEHKSELKT